MAAFGVSRFHTFGLAPAAAGGPAAPAAGDPFLVVLGIAQDGGVPQAGTKDHRGWRDLGFARHAACLAIVHPGSSRRWLIEATPDFRRQLHVLDEIAPVAACPGLDGIFLTHAHIGHYSGLMFLGEESMGAREVPVHAMPRMGEFLRAGGPWEQLVRRGNVALRALRDGEPVPLGGGLEVTPFLVPHRQEYSEVVGYRVEGPRRSVLFVPDIDRWEDWDATGTRLEDVLARADVAYLDGTFYADGEIPGRDMSSFPHPFITHSMDRLGALPPSERAKVRFIHLNHTNPALAADGDARRAIEARGFRVAEELERVEL